MRIPFFKSDSPEKGHFIVFKEHKLIYARVPKVANSSIKTALTSLVKINPVGNLKPTNDRFWNECTYGATAMCDSRGALKLRPGFFSFTFVRDPLDRLISCYTNKFIANEHLSGYVLSLGYRKDMSFSEFVIHTCNIPDKNRDVHVRSQSAMMLFADGTSPEFIGKYENLDHDWKRLIEILEKRGLLNIGPLPNINSRKIHRKEINYSVDTAVLDRIKQTYRRDYELFYPHLL